MMWKMYLFPWMCMAGWCKTTGEASGKFFLFDRCCVISKVKPLRIQLWWMSQKKLYQWGLYSQQSDFFSIRCRYKETEHLWNTRIQSKNPYILNSMQLWSNVFWWYPQTVDGFFSGDRQLVCQQQTVFKTCISVFITFFSAFHTESCFVYFFMLLTYKL